MVYEVVIDNRSACGEIFEGLMPPPRRSTGKHLILDCSKIEMGPYFVFAHVDRPKGQPLQVHLPLHAVAAISEREDKSKPGIGFQPTRE